MQPCSEIVKLIACIVADETLDARGVLRVRDSKLFCDPRSGISKFHERVFDEAVLKSGQKMRKYSPAIKLTEKKWILHT
jgi:hypothetical protein